jgi:hypothetical protein
VISLGSKATSAVASAKLVLASITPFFAFRAASRLEAHPAQVKPLIL